MRHVKTIGVIAEDASRPYRLYRAEEPVSTKASVLMGVLLGSSLGAGGPHDDHAVLADLGGPVTTYLMGAGPKTCDGGPALRPCRVSRVIAAIPGLARAYDWERKMRTALTRRLTSGSSASRSFEKIALVCFSTARTLRPREAEMAGLLLP